MNNILPNKVVTNNRVLNFVQMVGIFDYNTVALVCELT